MTGPHGDSPAPDEQRETDSAGAGWGGRHLSPAAFADDTGGADPTLAAALACGASAAEVMAAVRGARLLVPVLAEVVEEDNRSGPTADNRVGMASVTLVAPDGRRALPVFTSLESMARWDPSARPVPATAARVGQAAVSESCEVVVIDAAGPVSTVLRPSMVWALAQDRDWTAPHDDPFVATSVERAVVQEPDVVGHEIEEGRPAGEGVLGVVLVLRPGLEPQAVRALATRVGERLATDGELRARIDGLAFRIR